MVIHRFKHKWMLAATVLAIAAIILVLTVPKAEAQSAKHDTLTDLVEAAALSVSCANSVGYVHRSAAEKMVYRAVDYGKQYDFQVDVMEWINYEVPYIMTLDADGPDAVTVCKKLSRFLEKEYAIFN